MASPGSFASMSPQHQFGSPEHREAVVCPEITPRQHEEARAAPTVDGGPVEIEFSVVVSDSPDIDPPMRIVGIGGARSSGAARTCTPTCTS
jgi:hypothetical protein